MGNQMYDKNPELGFSARVNNLYVVAPGSIHPLTKQRYEIVKDVEIVPAPDDLIAWLQAEITKAEGSKPKTEGPRASDAEIEHQRTQLKRYLAFGGFDILKEKFEGGRWTILLDPNQCPFGGHRPGEGSVAVFVNADGAFGFKCIHCTPEHEWANPNNHNEDFHWEHFRARVDRSRRGKIFSGFKKFGQWNQRRFPVCRPRLVLRKAYVAAGWTRRAAFLSKYGCV